MARSRNSDKRPDPAGQPPYGLLHALTAPFRRHKRATQEQEAIAAREEAIRHQFHDVIARLDMLGSRLDSLETKLQPLARCIPLGQDVLSRTPWGWLLHPGEDLALLAGMLNGGGLHESGTRTVLQSILKPNDVCVDAGAHIGMLTVVMAHAVLPAGKVIAIEPTPRLGALLRRTAVLNNMQDLVMVEACALGQEDGIGLLSTDTSMMNNSLVLLEKAIGAIEVPVRRLDSLIAPGTEVTLAKLDVEGAELVALAGMSRVIADSPDIALIVEYGPSHLRRAGTTAADWISSFRTAGFTPWEIEETDGTIRPLRTSGLDEIYSVNLLMLRHAPQRWPRLKITE